MVGLEGWWGGGKKLGLSEACLSALLEIKKLMLFDVLTKRVGG